MRNTKSPLLFLLIVTLFAVTPSFGQGDSLEMDMTIFGTKELFLKNAAKLSSWPQIKESVVEMPSIKYTLLPNKQQVQIEPKSIKPAKVNVEPRLTKLYKGYVKAGFGLYTTPLLDVYYMDGRSKGGVWGVNFNHLSSNGGVALEDSIPDNFSNNELNLWGRKFLKKHALEGDLNWKRDVINYYGFDPYLYWDEEVMDLEQRFNNLGASLALTSYHRDSSKVNYRTSIGFRNYSDQSKGIENNVNIDTDVRTTRDKELYSGKIGINYNDFTFIDLPDSNETNKTNLLLQIEPKVTTRVKGFMVAVGAGIWLDARGDRPFHFYPLAEASYSLLDDLFIPYAGLTGRMELNTYQSITQENPFVLNNIELKNTNRRLEFFGGIRGTLSSSTSFNARIATTRFEDFMYFVNDSAYSPGSRFNVLYDDLTVFNIRGEVTIATKKNFRLQATGDYFIYSTEEALYPWYQPTTRLTLSSSYSLQDKLIVQFDVFTEGQRKATSLVQHQDGVLESDGSYTVDLNGYADANLGIEYRYTKRLSAWVRFNNMFAARYQRWNNYNVQRFNAMLGATYSF